MVPEPTPAPTYLGRLQLQAKKAAPTPYTKIIHFELVKSEILIPFYFGPYLPFKLPFKSCLTLEQGFSFLLA